MEESIIQWPSVLLSCEPFYGFAILLGLVVMLVEVFEAILGSLSRAVRFRTGKSLLRWLFFSRHN